jgi:GntR family transcriptional regulator/MocR family aminotransferase
MHLLARPAADVSDIDLAALAEQRGLAPSALSQHALAAACGPGLLLSFTNIPEDRAAAAAQALFEAIGPCLG